MCDRTPVPCRRVIFSSVILAVLSLTTLRSSSSQTRQLTFEERVKAQEAIERVYYSHQIGATRPFEQAVPREVLENKVRTYLKQSVVLETLWNTPVTAETLRAEVERMLRGSRMPDRLRELFAALGNDAFLIQECLARPALVGRLVRSFFAYDQRIHAEARLEAEELHRGLLTGRIDPFAAHPNRTEVWLELDERQAGEGGERRGGDEVPGRNLEGSRIRVPEDEFQRWWEGLSERLGAVEPLVEGRDRFLTRAVLDRKGNAFRVAGFAVLKRSWGDWWREVEAQLDVGAVRPVASDDPEVAWDALGEERKWSNELHDPVPVTGIEQAPASPCADDTWDNGSLDDFPAPRTEHTAVWTGTHMIIWGGVTLGYDGNIFYLNTGGRYDPATDTWMGMSTTDAPQAREDHSAVWTGSRMVIWGGRAYDASGLPVYLNTGGAYDPATDSWVQVTSSNAPQGRSRHIANWTGNVMVVWGGSSQTGGFNTGGRYDPVTDTWSPTSTTNAPSVRGLSASVWTGRYLVVWGGSSGTALLNTGGRYDPASDTWTPTTTINAPSGRARHTAVWTGSQMVVWGGIAYPGPSFSNGGGRYDPATDSWAPISTTGAPAPRSYHSSIWTGSQMVVWGGKVYDSSTGWVYLTTGGRYDPVTDTWSPTSTTNAPFIREDQTAVWTGNHIVIWGGIVYGFLVGLDFHPETGGRYDPVTDTWTPTSTTNAPSGRTDHRAVWTGSLMLIWGGHTENDWTSETLDRYHDTGGRYDPATDTWTPTSMINAPSARAQHAAVWTGDVMVVWGGATYDRIAGKYNLYDTGGRYDPVTDAWTPTSVINVPSGRYSHTAVWTGSRMVVWGGQTPGNPTPTFQNTGGRYDPTTDTWLRTSVANAPTGRIEHAAVWSGRHMIVWGGTTGVWTSTGGRYDPTADTWSSTSSTSAPEPRGGHSAVWTGSRMVIWGGAGESGGNVDTGGRYDPVTDTWSATSITNAPWPRWRHTAVWSGRHMIVWGGFYYDLSGSLYLSSGGRYDPVTDTWNPVSTTNAPSARYAHQAVWTDGLMLVWGGNDGLDTNTGGRYCACVGRTYYLDADGDGYGNPNASVESCTQPTGYVTDGTDCDDSKADLWGTPGEVRQLLLLDDRTLSWSPPAEAGATSVAYDVIRSGNPTDFVAAATCVLSDGSATMATDLTTPAPGVAFFYLARAQNGCPFGDGSLGVSSDGTLRMGRTCP